MGFLKILLPINALNFFHGFSIGVLLLTPQFTPKLSILHLSLFLAKHVPYHQI
nr:unnamed protein product [Callosobruchus chinensis]